MAKRKGPVQLTEQELAEFRATMKAMQEVIQQNAEVTSATLKLKKKRKLPKTIGPNDTHKCSGCGEIKNILTGFGLRRLKNGAIYKQSQCLKCRSLSEHQRKMIQETRQRLERELKDQLSHTVSK